MLLVGEPSEHRLHQLTGQGPVLFALWLDGLFGWYAQGPVMATIGGSERTARVNPRKESVPFRAWGGILDGCLRTSRVIWSSPGSSS